MSVMKSTMKVINIEMSLPLYQGEDRGNQHQHKRQCHYDINNENMYHKVHQTFSDHDHYHCY